MIASFATPAADGDCTTIFWTAARFLCRCEESHSQEVPAIILIEELLAFYIAHVRPMQQLLWRLLRTAHRGSQVPVCSLFVDRIRIIAVREATSCYDC